MHNVITPRFYGQQLRTGHWSTDRLVFLWRGMLAGPPGNVVDESIHGNNAPITGAKRVGNGLDFNGAGRTVATPVNPSGWGQFTVMCRYLPTVINAIGHLFDNTNGGVGLAVRTSSTGEVSAFAFLSGTGLVLIATSVVLVPGKWAYITFVYNGNRMELYFNGVLSVTSGVATGTVLATATDLFMGSEFDGTDNAKGIISNASIYDRALSASEIMQFYLNLNLPMQQDMIALLFSGTPVVSVVPDEFSDRNRNRYESSGRYD